MTKHRIHSAKISLKLTTLSISALSLLGMPQAALSQTLAPEESVAEPTEEPSSQPTSIPVPNLVVPELPTLREFSRYLPEDTTIRLLLKLSQRKVYVYQGEKVLASYPVAIGRPDFPTPTGDFQVREMIVNPAWQNPWTGEVEAPGIDGSLGLRWIGFTEVKGGSIGFHGTPNVASIGRAVSHGCVRLRNEDVVKLYGQVKIGTIVRVEP